MPTTSLFSLRVSKTRWFMRVVLLIIIVYDVWAWLNSTPGDTISEVVLAYSYDNVFWILWLGVGVGILLGHLEWPQNLKTVTKLRTALLRVSGWSGVEALSDDDQIEHFRAVAREALK